RDRWGQYIFFVSMYGVKRKNCYSACCMGFRAVNSIFVWGKFSCMGLADIRPSDKTSDRLPVNIAISKFPECNYCLFVTLHPQKLS
ncbi:MAG: hypothetical protein AB4368_30980, partial [Xenococcaceae cyanobacterium]